MKKIIVILSFIFLCVGAVSADSSDGLFCSVKKEAVTISLKQTTGYYKCKDTIASLEHLIISTAKDMMKVQSYITNGRDLEYRQKIKIEKKALLDKLQLSRLTIIANMKTFQGNLLQKSIQYFIIKVTPYRISLQKSLVKIQALSGVATPSLNSYALLLKAQVAVIEKLGKVTTQAELTELLNTYVYLKQQIEGKSE